MKKKRKRRLKPFWKKVLAVCLSTILSTGLLADMGPVRAAAGDADSWEGDGTEDSPWLIKTNDDLERLAEQVNNNTSGVSFEGKYFKVDNNAEELVLTTPIGLLNPSGVTVGFGGIFDGNGKTIRLDINTERWTGNREASFYGLFGQVNGGTVRNVRVTGHITVKSKGLYCGGGIAGECRAGAKITNCVSEVTIDGTNGSAQYVGGIVGQVKGGAITNCYSTGKLMSSRGGGIAGVLRSGECVITNCYNIGEIHNLNDYEPGGGIAASTTDECSKSSKMSHCIALSLSVSCDGPNGNIARIVFENTIGYQRIELADNAARADMTLANGYIPTVETVAHGMNGASIAVDGSLKTTDVFRDWDPNIWEIAEEDFKPGCRLPVLKAVQVSGADWPILPGEAPHHVHDFSGDWLHNEDGHWHKCANDETTADYAAHTLDEGTVTKEPSETEDGEKERKCTVCDYAQIETLPAIVKPHVHDFSDEWSHNEEEHWHQCKGCSEKADVAKHSFSDVWSYNEDGHWHECECGATTDYAAHTLDEGTVTKEPTETETGVKERHCTFCGREFIETLPATGKPDVSGGDPVIPDTPDKPDVSGGDPVIPDTPDNPPKNPEQPGDTPDNPPQNPEQPGDTPDTPPQNPEQPQMPSDNPDDGNDNDQDAEQEQTAISASAGNNGTGGTGKAAEPKTGDLSHTEYWTTLSMIAGFSYLMTLFIDKKGGMTPEEKNRKVAALIAWAKRGGRLRRYAALAVIFLLLVYYHSIGRVSSKECGKLCRYNSAI